MTGDNAVTETDAIKTLNTEIMAGNGGCDGAGWDSGRHLCGAGDA